MLFGEFSHGQLASRLISRYRNFTLTLLSEPWQKLVSLVKAVIRQMFEIAEGYLTKKVFYRGFEMLTGFSEATEMPFQSQVNSEASTIGIADLYPDADENFNQVQRSWRQCCSRRLAATGRRPQPGMADNS